MRKSKQVSAGKAIVWAGRRYHVLGQNHKPLQMLLHQPLELDIGHIAVL